MQDLRIAVVSELQALVEEGCDIVVVVGDSTSTSKIAPFLRDYPERVVNVGIAEQNLVGMAAGLSLGGHVVFTANAAPFLTTRSAEQIKNDICYSKSNVKLLGLNAGVAYGPLASTHHALDDVSLMLGLGNIHIVAPADSIEARRIIRWSVSVSDPVYIRMDSEALPIIHNEGYEFALGEPDVLAHGDETLIISMGSIAAQAHNAVQMLRQQRISCGLVNLSSLRPLHTQALINIMRTYKRVVTVEEHSLHGGVGALVATMIARHRLDVSVTTLGIPEGHFSVCGSRKEIRNHYGIDAAGIVRSVAAL